MNIARFLRFGAPAVRAPAAHEHASIASVLQHIASPALAAIAEEDLRRPLEIVLGDGGGILQMGLAPRDLEITGDRFSAICDLRLTDRTRMQIRIEGDIDDRGRVKPSLAMAA